MATTASAREVKIMLEVRLLSCLNQAACEVNGNSHSALIQITWRRKKFQYELKGEEALMIEEAIWKDFILQDGINRASKIVAELAANGFDLLNSKWFKISIAYQEPS